MKKLGETLHRKGSFCLAYSSMLYVTIVYLAIPGPAVAQVPEREQAAGAAREVTAVSAGKALSEKVEVREVTLHDWTTGGPFGGDVECLAVTPSDPDVLYVGTAGGVYKSADGAATWATTGLAEMRVRSIAVPSDDPDVVWAGTDDGIFKSQDGGSTWVPKGLAGARVNSITIDPASSWIVFAGTGVRWR